MIVVVHKWVGGLVGWLVGWLVGLLVCWLVCWLVGWLVCWLVIDVQIEANGGASIFFPPGTLWVRTQAVNRSDALDHTSCAA